MSEPDETDRSDVDPQVTALLREEPVAVDPARRDAAIAAALELGATLWPAPPVDELGARRQVAAVPAPRRRAPHGSRRVALVAAAVVVIAGLGIAGVVANRGDGDFLAVSGSADESADSSATSSGSPAGNAEAGNAGAADSGAGESAPAESDTSGSTAQQDRAPSPDGYATTTAPASSAATADVGTFESVDALLDAMGGTVARNAAPEASDDSALAAGGSACAALVSPELVVIGRATVGSTPVWLAATGPEAAVLVVVDATTCAELGRR